MKYLLFLIIPVCAFLGAWSGSKNTGLFWRRYILPAILTAISILILKHWTPIFTMFMAVAFSTGYGIPDFYGKDKGSAVGRFWFNLGRGSHLFADVMTRGTISLMVCLSLLPQAISSNNWGAIFFIPTVYITFGALVYGEGKISIGDKYEILVEDLIIYGTIGLVWAVLMFS